MLAAAQITGLAETGMRINEQPVVKVDLHITGPGFDVRPIEERVTANVTRQASSRRANSSSWSTRPRSEYEIDWEAKRIGRGRGARADSPSAEDNRTYDLSGQAGPLMEILQILKANNLPLSRMVDIRSTIRRCASRSRRWSGGRPSSASSRRRAAAVAAPPQRRWPNACD